MKVIDLIRLIRKHLAILILTPISLALVVMYFTRTPTYKYSSETMLFTGIASGSSIEMDKSISFFATNTAFDNLINIIKSRETHQEVAIRLLAQHLMLSESNPRYISKNSFIDLRKITPEYIKNLVIKSSNKVNNADLKNDANTSVSNPNDSLDSFSFLKLDTANQNSSNLPSSINKLDYEQTVENLVAYMGSSDTNFVYKLLYFSHPHYSIKAISSVSAQRISSSDLVKLKFESDDPGICQQTLALLTEVCIKNYKKTKENSSDAVVKYFEYQLKQASNRLKLNEDKLLKFNENNNIINYYEQSKAIAVVKEDLDVEYNKKRIQLAGNKAAITSIEEKLGIQQQVQLKSTTIIEKRNELSALNSKIAIAETIGSRNLNDDELVDLKINAEKLKEEIRESINEFFSYSNNTEGLPIDKLLNDWINNVIEYEDTKAGIEVLGDRIKEFQKQYAIYAPAGANLKRIEREISVSEQEFLEILHGLNLAKLKVQDAELSSTIKTIDPPFFPLSPNPTKRKILIILAAMIGFIFVLSSILAAEYFDDTLKNTEKASLKIQLQTIGIFPKIIQNTVIINYPFVINRLLEMIIQQIDLLMTKKEDIDSPRTILFISTLSNDGKTTIAANLALKLKNQGKKVLFLNYSLDSQKHNEIASMGYQTNPSTESISRKQKKGKRFRFIASIFGTYNSWINLSSKFLRKPEEFLEATEYMHYSISADYFSLSNYNELIQKNNIPEKLKPQFIIIEIPPLLYYSYPPKLIASADLVILVCRANRVWSVADKGTLEIVKKLVSIEPVIILNGIQIQVVESALGDLPKNRSRLRRILKNIFRLQFNSRYHP
jgi:polysaccharide biosynthesis transport protein